MLRHSEENIARVHPDGLPKIAVLVHGLWMTGHEMRLVRRKLRRAGYRTYRFWYSSVSKPLKWNVEHLRDFIRQLPEGEINLVGHSFGGVMIKELINRYPELCTGRALAMGSPFNGCWTARRFARLPLSCFTIGKSISETMRIHTAELLEPKEFGVLAGNMPLGVARLVGGIPGPNDGTVGVEETRLKGATDHVVHRVNHFGMLAAPGCLRQVQHFLKHGHFAAVEDVVKRKRPAMAEA